MPGPKLILVIARLHLFLRSDDQDEVFVEKAGSNYKPQTSLKVPRIAENSAPYTLSGVEILVFDKRY